MKRLKPILLGTILISAAQLASAINYTSGDLMLVFRKNGATSSVHVNNVEFDIGRISTFMGYASGSVHAVSFDLTLVKNSFGGSMSGVKFAVIGSVPQGAPAGHLWATDGILGITPSDMPVGAFSTLRGIIEAVGTKATFGTSSNASTYYVVDSQNVYAFDYLATSGQPLVISPDNVGGNSPFPPGQPQNPMPVDAINPATVAFYQVDAAGSPLPAGTLLGAFTLDVQGNLTYTAYQLPTLPQSQITQTSYDPVAGQTTMSFTTALGCNYKLLSTPTLNPTAWQQVPGTGTANGDGTTQIFTDTTATDPVRFYKILSTY
ncbi:MAG: hypothetical protein C5B50_23950 [Verrucomicrobia bacterium]|nr:MAG: hypothetical protein C5B50_23950 [Verrucomicrobiota bacterium]